VRPAERRAARQGDQGHDAERCDGAGLRASIHSFPPGTQLVDGRGGGRHSADAEGSATSGLMDRQRLDGRDWTTIAICCGVIALSLLIVFNWFTAALP